MTDNLPAARVEPGELVLMRAPQVVLDEAKRAAGVLKNMIAETKSSIRVGNSEHIKFEAWQTVGTFFHVTARTSPEPCEIDGIKGAKATADLIDAQTGLVVGGAVAYCMRDESNWAKKPWFQLSSMAQTRAASKALANKFRWISVLAGYAPTPAEEMEGTEAHQETHGGETVTWEAGTAITEIRGMLAKMSGGDLEIMEGQLKAFTKWTDKEKNEKWLKLEDLPRIANKKPDWLKRIHAKISAEYKKALDEENRQKQSPN